MKYGVAKVYLVPQTDAFDNLLGPKFIKNHPFFGHFSCLIYFAQLELCEVDVIK